MSGSDIDLSGMNPSRQFALNGFSGFKRPLGRFFYGRNKGEPMSLKDTISCSWDVVSATIAQNTSLSSLISLGGLRLSGLVMPDAWDTADLTFQVSIDQGMTWHDLKDSEGNEIVTKASASDGLVWSISAFVPYQFIRVRSGHSGLPVNQDADRTLQLVLRGG